MSGGRTMWFAQDVARHRRALMVELQDSHGPAALAIDTVLEAHAKEQNDGGRIRDGFASIAREAGMAGQADTVRAFIEDAHRIGWLDDLEVDVDGRRFLVRISGWSSDQDKARAAWRQAAKRDRDNPEPPVTDRDKSRSITESHPTAQHSTAQNTPPVSPPRGGRAGRRGTRGGLAVIQPNRWHGWALEQTPDLEPSFAASAAATLDGAGLQVTPEAVRMRVHARLGDHNDERGAA